MIDAQIRENCPYWIKNSIAGQHMKEYRQIVWKEGLDMKDIESSSGYKLLGKIAGISTYVELYGEEGE